MTNLSEALVKVGIKCNFFFKRFELCLSASSKTGQSRTKKKKNQLLYEIRTLSRWFFHDSSQTFLSLSQNYIVHLKILTIIFFFFLEWGYTRGWLGRLSTFPSHFTRLGLLSRLSTLIHPWKTFIETRDFYSLRACCTGSERTGGCEPLGVRLQGW